MSQQSNTTSLTEIREKATELIRLVLSFTALCGDGTQTEFSKHREALSDSSNYLIQLISTTSLYSPETTNESLQYDKLVRTAVLVGHTVTSLIKICTEIHSKETQASDLYNKLNDTKTQFSKEMRKLVEEASLVFGK